MVPPYFYITADGNKALTSARGLLPLAWHLCVCVSVCPCVRLSVCPGACASPSPEKSPRGLLCAGTDSFRECFWGFSGLQGLVLPGILLSVVMW